jgi:hypothetical protein
LPDEPIRNARIICQEQGRSLVTGAPELTRFFLQKEPGRNPRFAPVRINATLQEQLIAVSFHLIFSLYLDAPSDNREAYIRNRKSINRPL